MRLTRSRSAGGQAETKKRNEPNTSTQSWFPLVDLVDGILVRTDGSRLATVIVNPSPFQLLSDSEKARRINSLRAVFQSLETFQLLSICRPVDLDSYLGDLRDRLVEADGPRRRVLRGYLEWVQTQVRGGDALERRFAVVLTEQPRQGKRESEAVAAVDEILRKRARQLIADLEQAGFAGHLADSQEVGDLLFAFFQPFAAAREDSQPQSVTTLWGGASIR